MKMWSGRFRQPPDSEFDRWQRSLKFDFRLLAYEISSSSAHARALKDAGVLNSDELISILEALEKLAKSVDSSPNSLNDTEAEDVHHFVEQQLVSLIGETGYKLHSGRSRNEQIAADLRLYVRQAIDELRNEIAELCAVLMERAERSGTSAMPVYTHLQRAEPVLVAHWLLAYFEMFMRDAERLVDCRKRTNVSPLGSGAAAGATLPLDRRAIANHLEFTGTTANSIDATSDRDFILEFVNVLSLLGLHISRWAEEMVLFSSQEFGFIALPEAYSTGSSAMPQKKNPDLLELARAKSARVIGDATTLTVALKGLPLAYNKDLQETQEPLFDAFETVASLLPLVSGWLRSAAFNYERMQRACESGFMNAWAAATYLVNRGVPARLAHEAIGKAVQCCIAKNCELQDLPLEQLRQFRPEFDKEFYASVKLDAVLSMHDVSGGTAPSRVKHALTHAREKLESMREEINAHA